MVLRYFVDGSNFAYDGGKEANFYRLRGAARDLHERFPHADQIVVCADASLYRSFGDNAKQKALFESACAKRGILVAPAGIPGGGDAFVVGLADHARRLGEDAVVVSNDSFRELQTIYPWLIRETGRIIGGRCYVDYDRWEWWPRRPVRNEGIRGANLSEVDLLKRRPPNPMTIVECRITGFEGSNVLVDFNSTYKGIILPRGFPSKYRWWEPDDLFSKGQVVFAEVSDIVDEFGRIGLSIRRALTLDIDCVLSAWPDIYGLPLLEDDDGNFIGPEGYDPRLRIWGQSYPKEEAQWIDLVNQAEGKRQRHVEWLRDSGFEIEDFDDESDESEEYDFADVWGEDDDPWMEHY